jgi:uncharacterized protein (DUF58 family)
MDKERTREILKKVRQVEIRTNRLADDTLAGHYHSVFKGRGMNFEEVREYVPGDEVRTIDWNVTARTGKVFVKKFTEERELTLILMIDLSASGHYGSVDQSKRELAAELASVLAFSAVRNNDKVGLVLFTGAVELYIPPAKGRSHILRVIREILFFEPQGTGTELSAALEFIGRVQRRRAVVFLISDYCLTGALSQVLPPFKAKLQVANRRHDFVAMAINDPREWELPPVGLLTLEDAETGEQVEVNTGSRAVREDYRRLAQTRRQEMRRGIQSCGVDYLELTPDKPYLPTLLGFFKRREGKRR